MRESKFFIKKGKRYIAIDEYRDGFYGLPSDGLLFKHNIGLTCFLNPKSYDNNLDISKLSYLQSKTSMLTRQMQEKKLSVYNISPWDFSFEIIKRVSKKNTK